MDSSSLTRTATLPKKRSRSCRLRATTRSAISISPTAPIPVGFNVLEDPGPDQRAVVADGIVSGMRAIWIDMWGPRLEQILRHSLAALIETPNASLVLLPRLLTDARLSGPHRISRHQSLSRGPSSNANSTAGAITIARKRSRLSSTRSTPSSSRPAILNVIGQAKSTLHFEHAMAKKRVVIANLARGIIGETPSNLMGALLLARVQAAGMARASLPPEARTPFHIVIDEVQLFGTEVIAQILSEARKYGLSLTMATQFMAGLSEKTRAAVMGNVAALIVFRVGHEDAMVLAPEFDRPHQAFNPYALRQLPRGEAMVRISSAEGELVEMHPDPLPCGNAERVKRQSRIHYGERRDEVESAYSAY